MHMPGSPVLDATIGEDAYHTDPCPEPSLSSSIAHVLVTRSPLHAWHLHPKLGGGVGRRSAAMDRGSLIHKLLLGRGARIAVIDADDYRTKAAREERDAARATGKIPVLAHEWDEARRVAEIIRTRIEGFGFRLDGESEVCIRWQEPAVGGPVWCRCLLDHVKLAEAHILDVKTSRSARPDDAARSVVSYGYDIQRAAYVRALETARPELAGRVKYTLLFVETEPPYAVTPARLDGVLRERGDRLWTRAVHTWATCLRSGEWPAYVDRPVYLEAPPWVLAQMHNEQDGSE